MRPRVFQGRLTPWALSQTRPAGDPVAQTNSVLLNRNGRGFFGEGACWWAFRSAGPRMRRIPPRSRRPSDPRARRAAVALLRAHGVAFNT